MGVFLSSLGYFLPYVFLLHVVGIIWEMVVRAFRGRFG